MPSLKEYRLRPFRTFAITPFFCFCKGTHRSIALTIIPLAASSAAAHAKLRGAIICRFGRITKTHDAGHIHDGAACVNVRDLTADAVRCTGEVDIKSELLVGGLDGVSCFG